MKRTNRDKDWTFITALGVRMVESDDDRGWLHVFTPEALAELSLDYACPPELAVRRPALQLALKGDPRAAGALNAERKFWEELDRRRIQILERHLRPYFSAVRKSRFERKLSLLEDHGLRVDCATRHLPPNPLKDYGVQKLIDEAKEALVDTGLIPVSGLTWLPDVRIYFEWLIR